MPDQYSIAVLVKLKYWEAYRAAVTLTVRQFRIVLIIFGIIGTLMLLIFVFAVFHLVDTIKRSGSSLRRSAICFVCVSNALIAAHVRA